MQVIVFAIGRELAADDIAGTAIAFTNMLVMLGGVIFQPVIGMLLDTRWNGVKINNTPIYSLTDYKFALFVIPVGLALSVLLMLFMRETQGKVLATATEVALAGLDMTF